jgi:hypothetical protein
MSLIKPELFDADFSKLCHDSTSDCFEIFARVQNENVVVMLALFVPFSHTDQLLSKA